MFKTVGSVIKVIKITKADFCMSDVPDRVQVLKKIYYRYIQLSTLLNDSMSH